MNGNDEPEMKAENVLEMPSLGHQLSISKCSRVGQVDDWVYISPVFKQKLLIFIRYFVVVGLLVFGALCVIMLPDFIFDYSHRDAGFLIFLGKFMIAALGIIMVCIWCYAWFRSGHFYLSPGLKLLVCASRLTERSISEGILMTEIQGIEYVSTVGWFLLYSHSKIVIRLHDREFVLTEAYGNPGDIMKVHDWLKNVKKACAEE
ncbi:MAG: hypothetical protein IJM59_06860 [Proteobacteria bacterium]|nr:hypothetical protein [Pseudomonadota bacterium]